MNGHLVKVNGVFYYMAGYSDIDGSFPSNDYYYNERTGEWDMIEKPSG
jgi:hypothetical protein